MKIACNRGWYHFKFFNFCPKFWCGHVVPPRNISWLRPKWVDLNSSNMNIAELYIAELTLTKTPESLQVYEKISEMDLKVSSDTVNVTAIWGMSVSKKQSLVRWEQQSVSEAAGSANESSEDTLQIRSRLAGSECVAAQRRFIDSHGLRTERSVCFLCWFSTQIFASLLT